MIMIFVLIQGLAVYAQEKKIITGKVTTFGVIPLNNVEFIASKSGQVEVAYSDSLGIIRISCPENAMIRISASGFDRTKLKAKRLDQSSVDLIYSNSKTSFEEATKNGHISKENLAMAIEKYPLKGEKDYSKYSTIFDLIDTEIYNVTVSGTTVTSTKPNSLSASQEVLYVVDKMIVRDISHIVTSEVAAIKYVDGPEATQYGSRGANGAIEITLK